MNVDEIRFIHEHNLELYQGKMITVKSQEKSSKDNLTLLPCPFCGASIEYHRYNKPDYDGTEGYARHPVVSTSKERVCLLEDYNLFPCSRKNIEMWNRRAHPDVDGLCPMCYTPLSKRNYGQYCSVCNPNVLKKEAEE